MDYDPPLEQENRLQRERLYALLEYVRLNRLNRQDWDAPDARLGIVTTGKSYGDVTANVTAVDINLAMPRTNTSGCEASDFAGFSATAPLAPMTGESLTIMCPSPATAPLSKSICPSPPATLWCAKNPSSKMRPAAARKRFCWSRMSRLSAH